MRDTFLPYNRPELDEAEVEAVSAVIRSRWITRGPEAETFEAELSQYLGGQRVVLLASCTAGLHLALVALGIGPGDEVITTPMTFAASVNVIEHVGATPVLVDIDPDTGNINPERVRAAVTTKTRAILPVHYAGHPVDMDAIDAIAAEYGLKIVEDAAHALAASYRGRKIGSGPHFTAFSFYATKNLATGEGGALVIPDDEELEQTVRVLSLHGMSRNAWNRYAQSGSWAYAVQSPGYKYNMTDIQAAMGRVQLAKLDAMQQRRRAIAEHFQRGLADLPVVLPAVRPEVDHAWHLYPLRLDLQRLDIGRDTVVEQLKTEENIGTSVHFIPIHLHPFYARKYGWKRGDFPLAEEFFDAEISLPLYPGMDTRDVADVIAAVRRVVSRHVR